MWTSILVILAVVIPLNILLWLISAWYLAKLYRGQFQDLRVIIAEAMAQRDAEFQRFKGKLATGIIRDMDLFDNAVEDRSDWEEEATNGYQEDDPTGD